MDRKENLKKTNLKLLRKNDLAILSEAQDRVFSLVYMRFCGHFAPSE